MTKRKPRTCNPIHLVEVIEQWNLPFHDERHGYFIYVEGNARSNQTRVEHIVEYSHDLKVRDLKRVPKGINKYLKFKKDPYYKNTFNYYITRGGKDRGFIKVSIQVDHHDSKKAWIKTIYITYVIK